MQHFPQFQFLISDPGGCFVSNELREWASIRGIGLLTSPGEFPRACGGPGESDPSYHTFGQKIS